MKDGVEFEEIELNADNEWKKEYTDFVEIPEYTIEVEAIPGYTVTASGSMLTERHEVIVPPAPPIPSIEDRVEDLEAGMIDTQEGLMETFEQTIANGTSINECQDALMELYEMIIGG